MAEPTAGAAGSPHLMIGTPCYGGNLSHHYVISVLELQAACQRRGIGLTFKLLGNDSLITRARNLIVSQFLDDPQATHLMFIDADIGFAADRVFALLEADRDVAGAVYPMKMLDWGRIAAQAQAGQPNLKSSALNYVVDFAEPDNVVVERNFVKVRQIGTGFLLLRKSVFQRMAVRHPELKFNNRGHRANRELGSDNCYAFFDCMIEPETGIYLSEDYTFCRRWIDMGGEIWADMTSRLTHVGQVAFQGDLPSMLSTLGPAPTR